MLKPKEEHTVVVAIFAIMVLEGIALFKGMNGTLFVFSLVIVSGLGGYKVGGIINKILGRK